MKIQPNGTVHAAGILLFRKSPKPKFLLMRHTDRWDLPKGHSEAGESFVETALRETEEETGIPAKDIAIDPDFLFQLSYPVTYKKTGDKVFEKTVQYFLGFLKTRPQLILTEHEAAEWFDWNPPHQIQNKTIDPLLAAVASHMESVNQEPTV
ncbi:dihydroneopterin triphosphate pyrophosphatase [Planctomycetes bacterium CA13]|uniref:Bis(5'-nucleosyl)-tetraphosphatase [asymmetrical] n=1 Tax=Novipirellula herctigrandis TaxID=2527986 RepID=A0A5C5Z7M8_9BACT|nr:dihydroneopterin triphosphate pyrophosphatase [Planctomycetes bacterium CA13]